MRPVVVLLLLLGGSPALAQVNGHVSILVDGLPDLDDRAGAQHVTEARVRLFAEHKREIGGHLRLNLAGYVDGLFADRGALGANTARDVIVRPTDFFAEIVTSHVEIRAGASRLVWGRLDEFQPTDVVNPIDLARFLLEGRSEARMSVGLVRARVFLPASTTLEAVVVPAFRAGSFDELDEPTSPFNLIRPLQPFTRREEPGFGWKNVQGGGRLTSTARRVDWGVSAYRGIKAFPIVSAVASTSGLAAGMVETFPRFTMVGGDFETVHGPWGVRGELAVLVDDELQSEIAAQGVPGRSFQGGFGLDRRAGDYRVAANVLVSRQSASAEAAGSPGPGGAALVRSELERTDVMLVAVADRSFSRETRTMRVFTVYDPTDDTMFARVIAAMSLRDNVWLEGSGGLFTGSAPDTLGRLTRRDFIYGRLKVFF